MRVHIWDRQKMKYHRYSNVISVSNLAETDKNNQDFILEFSNGHKALFNAKVHDLDFIYE